MSNKIYSAKVSGQITQKIPSSSGGIDSILFNGTKKKITFVEYFAYNEFYNFIAIHFEDDSTVYVPADTNVNHFIPQ